MCLIICIPCENLHRMYGMSYSGMMWSLATDQNQNVAGNVVQPKRLKGFFVLGHTPLNQCNSPNIIICQSIPHLFWLVVWANKIIIRLWFY